ncbi:N-acetylmuramoyl-L-alanine amidase family protein [Clostridium uliginosum]|uniref:Putative cell wall binding repeat-containing protein n=1 Tax=Clostridium uliginosum TaxID=119641 RepID=A0A1I1JHW2_9CLOT|nr:N-acetylmuramoyl-L-alanine amidase family protein [Clostridium uliginosum]SFC47761.1 Putative cell wall binding repeat-containing protein [Clostridium uliginosum]
MIKKLITSLLIAATVISINPICANAAWKEDNNGWWYSESSSYSTGWKQIDGYWYYFDSNGYMKTGWLQDNGKWYYLIPSGVMKTGWLKDGLTWYYLYDNGSMVTGKVTVEGKTYELDSKGKLLENPQNKSEENIAVSTKPSEEKLKATPNYSWFEENGNKYFKLNDDCITGVWNIDGDTYIFDNNDALQKGEYTAENGVKYLFDNDGKYVKCLNKDNTRLYTGFGITTKSSTNNPKVRLDDDYMMNISDVFSSDPEKNGIKIQDKIGSHLDVTQPKATIKGKTLNCRTNQTVSLSVVEACSTDSNHLLLPNLLVTSKSTNQDVAFLGIDFNWADGYLSMICPNVIARKPGKTTITINVNGSTTSFDVVVTE